MTPTESMQAIAKLRRDMPRNKMVMDVCDAFEDMLVRDHITAQGEAEEQAKFDRVAYQREYMRKRRAADKAKKERQA